jgi:hypothetical protein
LSTSPVKFAGPARRRPNADRIPCAISRSKDRRLAEGSLVKGRSGLPQSITSSALLPPAVVVEVAVSCSRDRSMPKQRGLKKAGRSGRNRAPGTLLAIGARFVWLRGARHLQGSRRQQYVWYP